MTKRSAYTSGLTAGAFEMLIHYYYTANDVPDALTQNSNNYRSIKELESAGLIERNGDFHAPGSWQVTEKGKVMAAHILETPMPVQAWEMPSHP